MSAFPAAEEHLSATTPATAPPTVWPCPHAAGDPTRAWPTDVLDQITRSFPAETIAVLHPTESPATGDLTDVLDRLRADGHYAESVPYEPGDAAPRPYWAAMVTGQPALPAEPATERDRDSPVAWADLALAAITPGDAVTDALGLAAATALRPGGTFLVLTRTGHTDQDALLDPTGPTIAACQQADLLYLQHLIVLHTPYRHDRLTPLPSSAPVGKRHQQVHSDLLVFTQAHTDH